MTAADGDDNVGVTGRLHVCMVQPLPVANHHSIHSTDNWITLCRQCIVLFDLFCTIPTFVDDFFMHRLTLYCNSIPSDFACYRLEPQHWDNLTVV